MRQLIPAFAVALVLPLAACGGSGGGGGCTNTRLETSPAAVADVTAPLELKARLTEAGGKPIGGVAVTLEVTFTDEHGASHGTKDEATTGADGVATLARPGGLAAAGLSGWRPVNVIASYEPLGGGPSPAYCWARSAAAALTCGGGVCGPLP